MITGWLPDPETKPYWKDLLALFDLAAKRGQCRAWDDGDLAWVAADDGQIIGAATTRLIKDGPAELMHVAGMRGRDWFGPLEQQICEWARAEGRDLIVARGRKGWTPIVEKMGWKVAGREGAAVLYEKAL